MNKEFLHEILMSNLSFKETLVYLDLKIHKFLSIINPFPAVDGNFIIPQLQSIPKWRPPAPNMNNF